MPRKAIPLARVGWVLSATLLALWIVVPLVAGAPPEQRPPVTPGPRPPATTPTARSSQADEKDEDEAPVGAFIELHVGASPAGARAAPPGLWTVVQWQDSMGTWHAVEGWQGIPDTPGQKVWWVAQKDFGAGPFRWALYARQGGPLLAASRSFYLPSQAYQRVSIVVNLDGQRGVTGRRVTDGQAPAAADSPMARRPAPALMPTTGAPPANSWPSIILVLGLVIGAGLLLNHAKTRW